MSAKLPLAAGSWTWPSRKAAAEAMRLSPTEIGRWLDNGTFREKAIMRMVEMQQSPTQVEIVDGDQYLVSFEGVMLPRMCRRELEDFHATIREALKVPHKPVDRRQN